MELFGRGTRGECWLLIAAVAAGPVLMVGMAYCVLGGAAQQRGAARQVAGRDVLSGLPNRFLFNELVDAEIARCRRGRHQFALFYLDLDHFKQANDTFGHDVGDRLIVAFTRRLAHVLRACDHFARLGGDEFALMQADVIEPRDCARLAQRILDAMSAPFEINGQQIFIGVSIGIALCPQNAKDRQELMRLADLALYRSKQAGRNRFAFFEAKMGEELRMRQSAEDELRAAIENDELSFSISRSSLLRTTKSFASKRWRAGGIGPRACCLRIVSSRSPRSAGSSSRSANGRCAAPAPRQSAGPTSRSPSMCRRFNFGRRISSRRSIAS